MRKTLLTTAVVGVFGILCSQVASAAIIYQSATIGETGIPRLDVGTQVVHGANVSQHVFNGVRFEIDQPVVTSQIGGHFVGPFNPSVSSFFGAIVQLDNANDFPNSNDLSTSDVLGTTLLDFPEPSAEVYGDLSLQLEPGWYGLIFGSGLFGGEANGAAVLNNTDIGEPSYLGFVSGKWRDSASIDAANLSRFQFAVRGMVIPEPSTATLISLAGITALGLLLHRTHHPQN